MAQKKARRALPHAVEKCPTGVGGLDDITNGGLPRGRNSLICGGAGSGKTMLGMEILIRGARDFGEPGVVIAFEETEEELAENFASLGFDVHQLIGSRQLLVDYVLINRDQLIETGAYDLEGLIIRIGSAIDQLKAKRVLIDTIEVLFSAFTNEAVIRAELRRLFRFLKDKGVTTVITAESGSNALTRYGLEEYVADSVILLDHRVNEQVSTRRLRIVKYRGSAHGTNEYPFMMTDDGISVIPITSLQLTHEAAKERVPTGIAGMDEMLGGKGFFRGSSVLVTGTAGTGKSSFAASFADAACGRGEAVLYLAFEESPSQILRNMSSVGLDLQRWIKKGQLHILATRPTAIGLEGHLATVHTQVEKLRPAVVIMDPITNLISVADLTAVKGMLTRTIDFLKLRGTTAFFTNLTLGDQPDDTAIGISSLMDTWIVLRDVQLGRRRKRILTVLKSRGMAHSNEIREFHLDEDGISILDPTEELPEEVVSGGRLR
jgi:circadian clock protein KaiC